MTDRLRLATLKAAPVRARASAAVAALVLSIARVASAQTPPATAVSSAVVDPRGTALSLASPDGAHALALLFPDCEGAPGTTLTLRQLTPSELGPSALGGTVLAAHAFSTDHDLVCRALPAIYYRVTDAEKILPLEVEIRDGAGVPVGTVDQYRYGPAAFEAGGFPATAASTEQRFTAGATYTVALHAAPPSMVSTTVTTSPADLALPSAGGMALALHLPAASAGGGRLVLRTSVEPPSGVPPLVTTAGAPALAYVSALLFGNAAFAGEGRLTVTLPGRRAGAGLALYDAERWTQGWTPLPAAVVRVGRTLRFTLDAPPDRAIFKRIVLGIYPVAATTASAPPTPALRSLAFVPSAVRPLVTVVGDSTAVLSVVPPSTVGCTLDLAPPPQCLMTEDPALAVPGRLAALTGAQVVQLAWLASAAGVAPESDSELEWQVPQVPLETTTIVFSGGTADLASSPAPVLAHLDAIVTAMHARVPHARIVFVGVRYYNQTATDAKQRARIDAWDERERELSQSAGDVFIDLRTLLPAGVTAAFPDGAHPSPASADAIAREIAARMAEIGLS